jgi:beta-1,3-galactosyltransferase / beta-1,3-N-acetylglucosaminyltransferase
MFSLPYFKIYKLLFIGISEKHNAELQKLIDLEANNYNDIVQASFIDTYFNNTIKTMIGMQWAAKFCSRSRFYMFVDDDYYISTKNVLRFIRNPVFYPEYLEKTNEHLRKLARRRLYSSTQYNESDFTLSSKQTDSVIIKNITEHAKIRNRRMLDMDLPIDIKLFSGFVFQSSPHRHKSSKFYISLDEYPWHMWPTYVTAGAYILSREALLEMYYAAMYTKHFRFDDIFLGIVANKAHIDPLHSEEFYFYKASYVGHSYKYVIASHGYGNHEEMLHVWNLNKAAGYA